MPVELSLPSLPSSALFRCISPSHGHSSPSVLGAICFVHSAKEQVEQVWAQAFAFTDLQRMII